MQTQLRKCKMVCTGQGGAAADPGGGGGGVGSGQWSNIETQVEIRNMIMQVRVQAEAAQRQIREAVAAVKARQLPAAAALSSIRQAEQAWGASSSAEAEAEDAGGQNPGFRPVVGQQVAVRSMGDSAGTVMQTGKQVVDFLFFRKSVVFRATAALLCTAAGGWACVEAIV